MSYTFAAPKPGTGDSVDFDFFDDHGGKNSPTSLGKSSNSNMDDAKSKTMSMSKSHSKPPIPTRDSHSRAAVSKTRDRSPEDSYSSDYSDDTYSSDSDIETSDSKSVRKIEAKIPQVVTEDPDSSRENPPRPKTSLGDRSRSTRDKTPVHSSESDTYSDSETMSNTDSDVTDVSPLHSPNHKPPKSPHYKEVSFRTPPSSTKQRTFTKGHSDDIDLRLLMQAVLEMENNNPDAIQPRSDRSDQTFTIPRHPTSVDRKNFSFSNDNVRTIDKENQRLMQQIMRLTAKPKSKKKPRKASAPPSSPSKMSSSAINRNRAQLRIERENYNMLNRLLTVKPTTRIAKDELIKDYENQVLFGCSVAAAHPEPKKKKQKQPSPYTVLFNPSHMNHLLSGDGSGKRCRPASAKVQSMRPLSAKPQVVRPQSAINRTRPWSANSTGLNRPQSAKLNGPTPLLAHAKSSRPAWDDRFTINN